MKFALIALLALILVVYTNCGVPLGGPSVLVWENNNVFGGDIEASYAAFEQHVWPITRSRCVSCHSSIQPVHAASDVVRAHDAVVNQFKVNFGNLANSRMVTKLRDEKHNCWSSCESDANQILTGLQRWHDVIGSQGNENIPGINDQDIVTAQSRTLLEEFSDSTTHLNNTLYYSMESALTEAPMQKGVEGNRSFIWVNEDKQTTLGSSDSTAGRAFLNFDSPAEGSYRIWGLVDAPNTNSNAFYVRLRNANGNSSLFSWNPSVTNGFEWRRVSSNFVNVINGANTIEVRERKDGTKLAAVILTNDSSFDGEAVNKTPEITLKYDLSSILGISGASFEVDVEDYDPYSYRFRSPRITFSSQEAVRVKNIRLLINGSYNPQHSTYTFIDETVTSTSGPLSIYSMIVLKDHGLAGDRISFAFEELELVE